MLSLTEDFVHEFFIFTEMNNEMDYFHMKKEFGTQCNLRYKFDYNIQTVSYTHLDVYKRQL